MKFIIILVLMTIGIGLSFSQNAQEKDVEWEEYKKKFDKTYDTEEDSLRRAVYYKTKEEIFEHNKRYDAGLETYTKGITQFSDLTLYEFSGGQFGYIKE